MTWLIGCVACIAGVGALAFGLGYLSVWLDERETRERRELIRRLTGVR